MKNKIGVVVNDKKDVPHIVVPTIRSEEHFKNFLISWKEEFEGCHLIVVEDKVKKKLVKLINEHIDSYSVYDWNDIDKDLGKNSWIIPRKSDTVRSYGYYKAWQKGANMIVTLDDDVVPRKGHIQTFYKNLFLKKRPSTVFFNTLKGDHTPRGILDKEAVLPDVVHGGWENTPDYDAEEQIKGLSIKTVTFNSFNEGIVPSEKLTPVCGMNLAWKPSVTKHMYFGLQGSIKKGDGLEKLPIDRCGDIWCGFKLSDNAVIYTGSPYCIHTRASNPWSNLSKERNADSYGREFINRFTTKTINKTDNDKEMSDYFDLLSKAYKVWDGLFNE